jgi:glucose/arabinose dehydrogenase
MITRMAVTRALMVAGALGAFAIAVPAFAQQSTEPAKPLPKGSTLIGRPDNDAAKKLSPVAPPPIPAAADKIPLDKLKVPRGFKVELYASGAPGAREMVMTDKGTLFVGTRTVGNLYAIVDKDGKREVKTIGKGMDRPNGVAFKDGTLYVAEGTRINKYENIEANLDNPPKPTVIYDKFPDQDGHGWKFIAIGPDNKLYVPVGQPCNNCIPDANQGQIDRMNLDGSGLEVFARGVRNTVGFDWRPGTHDLYFTDNGRDWMSEDIPNDELNRATKAGENFGAPYCYQGNIPDPEFGWGHDCLKEFVPPVALMGPHTASLGMRFYNGRMFPSQYRGAIFVARHGSWNRSKKLGGDIVVVQLNKNGTVRSVEPFLTGFLQDNKYIGRPVDVLPLKDGSLLISDDWNGAIYRVSYGSGRSASHRRR